MIGSIAPAGEAEARSRTLSDQAFTLAEPNIIHLVGLLAMEYLPSPHSSHFALLLHKPMLVVPISLSVTLIT
jgi:hypothetical protein